MFDTEREALYRQYQESTTKIVLMSLLDLAMSVRQEEPSAKYIHIEASDQAGGGYVCTGVTDAEGELLADDLEELDDDEGLEMKTLGNLQDGEFATEAWQLLAENDPSKVGEYRIDIDVVLERVTPADFAP